jgi:hypothetical protein
MPLTPEEEAELAELDKQLDTPRNRLRAFGSATAKGATAATDDELVAYLKSLDGVDVDQALAETRDRGDALEAAFPLTSAAGEATGAIATGIPAYMAADAAARRVPSGGRVGRALLSPLRAIFRTPETASRASRALRRATAGAVAGGTSGAVYGYGEGEGGHDERMQSAFNSAQTGATVGAPLGVAAPLLADLGKAGYRAARGAISPAPESEVARAAALRQLQQVLQRDKITTRSARNAVATNPKDVSLMDVGGENTLARTAHIGNMTGDSRTIINNFVDKRLSEQSDRLADDFSNLVAGGDAKSTLKSLGDLKDAAAGPAYKKAYAAVPQMRSPKLNELFARLEDSADVMGGSPIEYAEKLARLSPGRPPRPGPVMKENATGKRFWTVNTEDADFIDRALRDKIEKYGLKENQYGQAKYNEVGKELRNLRNELRTEIYRLNPDLKAARDEFSGFSASEDAVHQGKRIFKMDVDDLEDDIAAMTPADRDFFRIGVVKAIQDKMGSAAEGSDAVKTFFKQRRNRAVLEKAFDSKADWEAFETAMTREADMAARASRVKPKPTSGAVESERAGMDAMDAAKMAGRAGVDIATNNYPGLARTVIQSIFGRARAKMKDMPDDQAAELARMLTTSDQSEINAILREMDAMRATRGGGDRTAAASALLGGQQAAEP